MDVMSLEGTYSIELLEFQNTTKRIREARKGSNEVDSSSLGIIIELVKAGITSTYGIDCLATFKAFAGIISRKLDVFEITSHWAEQSFIFGF